MFYIYFVYGNLLSKIIQIDINSSHASYENGYLNPCSKIGLLLLRMMSYQVNEVDSSLKGAGLKKFWCTYAYIGIHFSKSSCSKCVGHARFAGDC